MPEPETSNLTIRDASPEDLDGIASLLQQLWPSSQISAASVGACFRKSFSIEGHIIRVAVYEKKIVGLCSLSIRNNLKAEGSLGNIDELVIDKQMRGNKIGKLFLEDAEKIARENGCTILGLESSFHREGAHQFYEGNGYDKKGFYFTKDLV